jgi:uncharacterized membrane protein
MALSTSLVCLLPSVAMVFYGFLNENQGSVERPGAMVPIYAMLLLQAVIAVALFIRVRSTRWMTASIGLMTLWVSYSIAFIVGMLVTGQYI